MAERAKNVYRAHVSYGSIPKRRGRWLDRLSAIHLARVYGERKQDFLGQHFWTRGHMVSTVAGM